MGVISIGHPTWINTDSGFLHGRFKPFIAQLDFLFIGRTAQICDPFATRADEVFTCQTAAFEIISGNGTTIIVVGREAPDNKWSIHLGESLYMILFAGGGHQNKAIHLAAI
ncbi:hypothetical protein SDC9_177829 [bioreactor metagenome]|uniref:Uncharacterized protein n=1 Tax=bioreactor metagenome TaxID=1076179 RepID=A0A645GU45_9ZZZZ